MEGPCWAIQGIYGDSKEDVWGFAGWALGKIVRVPGVSTSRRLGTHLKPPFTLVSVLYLSPDRVLTLCLNHA